MSSSKPFCFFCDKVGIEVLANGLDKIQYPECSKTNKDGSKCQTSDDLGNGNIVTDPDKAMDKFMGENFTDILNAEKLPHGIQFLPEATEKDVNLGKDQETANTKNEGNNKDREKDDKGKVLQNFKQQAEKNMDHNIFVISNWDAKENKKKDKTDFDILIISQPFKIIVHIEVRVEMKRSTINDAADHLQRRANLFKTSIPFPEKENWKYIKVIMFGKEMRREGKKELKVCENCKRFVIQPKTDDWWSTIRKEGDFENTDSSKTYPNAMKFILHEMFKLELPGPKPSLLSQNENETLAKGKIILLSKEQFSLLDGNQHKRVVFSGSFGTGKTTMLKAKARQLMEKNKEVIFIIFSNSDYTLLKLEIENEFAEFQKKKLFKLDIIPCIGFNLESQIQSKIKVNTDANYFFDEVFIGTDGIKPKILNEISKQISKKRYLWIACQSDGQTIPDETLIEEFFLPNMNQSFRYSKSLLSTVKEFESDIGSKGWPLSVPNETNKAKHQSSIFLTYNQETSWANTVEYLVKFLSEEITRTIIKIEVNESIDFLKNSDLRDRIIFNEGQTGYKEFLRSSDKILLLTSKSDFSIRGYEVPTLVLISNSLDGSRNDNVISSCKSKLILVCQENLSHPFLRFKRDISFYKIVSVSEAPVSLPVGERRDKNVDVERQPLFDNINTYVENPKKQIIEVKQRLKLKECWNSLAECCCCWLPPSWPKQKILMATFFAVLALILILIISLSVGSKNSDQGKSQTPKLLWRDCKNDNFTWLSFDESIGVKHLKYRFIPEMMSHEKMKIKCKDLGSSLWEVESEEEWKALMEELSVKLSSVPSMWLNGKVSEETKCDIGAECKRNEALIGNGLPVQWESIKQNYSRLYNGGTAQKKCILAYQVEKSLEESQPYLWTAGYCGDEGEERNGVCIKRNCIQEI